MENSTPSIADFAALMNRDDFGNGGIWVIILFRLVWIRRFWLESQRRKR